VVLTHAQALLTSSPEGQTDYIQADLRDTDTILNALLVDLLLADPVESDPRHLHACLR